LLGSGVGTFAAQVTYGAGSDPLAIAVGDFNGDGQPDLAAVNYESNTVSVLLNQGGGVFGPASAYPVGTEPVALVVADFNADGYLDLAAVNLVDNTVSVLLGTGTGTFGAQITAAIGQQSPQPLVVGDFNEDGLPDLAVVAGASLVVLLGTGGGGLEAQPFIGLPVSVLAVAAGDFNEDGHLDLAMPGSLGELPNGSVPAALAVVLGTGTGAFGPATTFQVGTGVNPAPFAIVAADFTSDGHEDLAIANLGDSAISILLGAGTGTFGAQLTFPVGPGPRSVAAGDFNGSGYPDIAVVNDSEDDPPGAVSVILNGCR
jgi:hypothetical protein